jgi:hypothetical protein
MEREEAIAFLRDLVTNRLFNLNWVTLVSGVAGYQLHIKPETADLTLLKPAVEKHSLSFKQVDGVLIIYKEHNGSQ